MKPALAVAAVVLLIAFGVALQVSVWNECRETNSFLYCLRIISR